MSKLDNLIKKLCPDGVKFEELKEICMVSIGEFVHKNKQREDAKYPVFNGGISNTGFYDEYNNEGNKILISARGANAGFINKIESRYWAGNSCYSIEVKDKSSINWLYVYYYLKNNEKNLLGQQQTGSIPAISKKQIESFKIAVPPLEVQCEIVHILDDFTLLSALLSAELKARQQQYEYYKDILLKNYSSNGNIMLKEIAEYSKDKINAEELNEDNYVGVDNLLPNKQGKKKSNHIPQVGNSTKYHINDILIGNIRPYLKKIWYANNKGGTNGDVLVIHITNERVNPQYLYYILSSDKFFNYDTSNSKGAKMPRGNKDAVMKYKFFLPTMEEQNKIVNILDKFEKLCNDISEGLPAEIKERQKQYEYYRDKLLTFKELKVNE